MQKKISVLAVLVVLTQTILAQREVSNWAFGHRCNITWNQTQDLQCYGINVPDAVLKGMPTSLLKESSLYSVEGVTTISDKYSNLLFYSEGINIYDGNHQRLTAPSVTLKGGISASQAVVAVPYPGNTPDKYLLITNDEYFGSNQLNYYESGSTYGSVIGPRKFYNAAETIGESMTVILHPNGKDYWVVAVSAKKRLLTDPAATTAYLNAWLFTEEGPSLYPVTTSFTGVSLSTPGALGILKFTADNKHFIWTSFSCNSITIGDFDPYTGQFSNIKTEVYLDQGSVPWQARGGYYLNYPYGVEFSPDQSVTYISEHNGLLVYKTADLFSGAAQIRYPQKAIASPQIVYSESGGGALQLGPDKRIYWTIGMQTYLRVIDNPNDFDNFAVYRTAEFLDPRNGNAISPNYIVCRGGLPQFTSSWFSYTDGGDVMGCENKVTKFTINIPLGDNRATSILWDFGDGTTIEQAVVDGVTDYSQEHQFTKEGVYEVTASPYKANGMLFGKKLYTTEIFGCLPLKLNPNVRMNLN